MEDRATTNVPFPGESEMHRRVNAADWSATSMGPVASWPQSLRATIATLLASRYPMILLWATTSCSSTTRRTSA